MAGYVGCVVILATPVWQFNSAESQNVNSPLYRRFMEPYLCFHVNENLLCTRAHFSMQSEHDDQIDLSVMVCSYSIHN
jgi:hypothetical protein